MPMRSLGHGTPRWASSKASDSFELIFSQGGVFRARASNRNHVLNDLGGAGCSLLFPCEAVEGKATASPSGQAKKAAFPLRGSLNHWIFRTWRHIRLVVQFGFKPWIKAQCIETEQISRFERHFREKQNKANW